MAIRPYAGSSGQRGASEPRLRGSGNGQAMMPFGGGPFGGGLFGGGDPFKEFGSDPFGGMLGGGFGGSIMQQFNDMTKDMASGRGSGSGSGQYSCQTFAMSSVMGPDGKMHTERFASSDVGNRAHGIRESQQAYSNSSSGLDKMGLERQLGNRARKMVKERDRNSMEERSTEMFRGMDESHRSAFDQDFSSQAHHLPQHSRFSGGALFGPGPGGHGGHQLNGMSRHSPMAISNSPSERGGGHRHRSVPGGRR